MKAHRALIKTLIVLLLFAQQGAYAHAISHLGPNTPAKEQFAHSKVCDRCASFEKISGAAPIGALPVLVLDAPFIQVLPVEYSFVPRTVAFFQGRAPPSFR